MSTGVRAVVVALVPLSPLALPWAMSIPLRIVSIVRFLSPYRPGPHQVAFPGSVGSC